MQRMLTQLIEPKRQSLLLLLLLHCHYEASSCVVQGKLGEEEDGHTIAQEVKETTLPEK